VGGPRAAKLSRISKDGAGVRRHSGKICKEGKGRPGKGRKGGKEVDPGKTTRTTCQGKRISQGHRGGVS